MAKKDYSRRSSKDVFWGDDNDNKNSSKSDELEELFRQSETLEQPKEQAPTPHEPAYEPEPEPEPTHDYDNLFEPEPVPEPEPYKDVEVDNPDFDYDSIVVNETENETETQTETEYDTEYETEYETETPPPYEPRKIAPTQNITPPPYIPSQTQSTIPQPTKSKEEILEGFDVENFIKDNSSNFSMTIFAKVVSVILCGGLLLKWVLNTPYLWWIIFAVALTIVRVLDFIFQRRYTNYINLAIKQIKKVKALNKTPLQVMHWESLLDFPYSNVYTNNEDEIVIVTDETKVFSCEMEFFRKVSKNNTETFLNCEIYKADMEGRTSFADNITLMKGNMPFIKTKKYFCEVSQYVLYYDDEQNLNECNIPRVCAIADRISAYLGDKAFAMHFNTDTITLALPTHDMGKYDYGFFDFTIEDRIRRDVTAIVDRVCLSDMLAEN